MKPQRTLVLTLLLICLQLQRFSALPQPAAAASTGSPVVRKIDPPNWWVNYVPELTLLLSGENLSGAHVGSASKGVAVVAADASANGHYLFVRLKVSSSRPETAQLKLKTASGSTSVQLPLLARADARGRFQGFSRDDVIYLIMPDRFADGDPTNNMPKGCLLYTSDAADE